MLFGWRVWKHLKSTRFFTWRGSHARTGAAADEPCGFEPHRGVEGGARRNFRSKGSVVCSDAFFPFPDGLIRAADAGATAAIQPGGSVKDAEVIAAADERGIAMVFTGTRHFRH